MILKTPAIDIFPGDCSDEIDEYVRQWSNHHIEMVLTATNILEIEFISVITGAIDDRF